jgi:hypothetical protein
MPENSQRYSAAWTQFLSAKRAMLAEYDRALAHSKEQVVSTHHEVVGEAAVRDWLGTFLPRRYGVVPGNVRSQGLPQGASHNSAMSPFAKVGGRSESFQGELDDRTAGESEAIPTRYGATLHDPCSHGS